MKAVARLAVVGMVTAAHGGLIAAFWRNAPAAAPPPWSVTVALVEPLRPPPAPPAAPARPKVRSVTPRPAPQPRAPTVQRKVPVLPPRAVQPVTVTEPAALAPMAPASAPPAEMHEAPPLARSAPPAPPAEPESLTPPGFEAAYLNNPPPAYPALSRRYGEQGKVALRVHVGPAGQVLEVEIRDSSGHQRLDRAAQAAVREWRFVPARRGDVPIAAWMVVPISFVL